MAELNAHSDRMVLIFSCNVKDATEFKTWSKDRASKYVHGLKRKTALVTNGTFLMTELQPLLSRVL